MGVVDFGQYVQQAIQAGTQVEGNVVKIIADNGAEIGDAVFKVIQGGNGSGQEVAVATTASGSGAVATGLAYMALDVGAVGAAIAPALGIAAGAGLYALAPDFWDNVSNTLMTAGQTVGGKVIAYWDGTKAFFSENVIEIFKNAFLNAGAFETTYDPFDGEVGMIIEPRNLWLMTAGDFLDKFIGMTARSDFSEFETSNYFFSGRYQNYISPGDIGYISNASDRIEWNKIDLTVAQNAEIISKNNGVYEVTPSIYGSGGYMAHYKYLTGVFTYNNQVQSDSKFIETSAFNRYPDLYAGYVGKLSQGNKKIPLQDGATYPTSDPFTITYPQWIPWPYPIPVPVTLPNIYPINYPGTNGDQQQSQNPDAQPWPEIYPIITPALPIPAPITVPIPIPLPIPDPDPFPEPKPIDPEPNPIPQPDPADPTPGPTPSPVIPTPPLPATSSSNKLFTVYNPSPSQLDALGGYLWDASIIATIRDIWQDPLDGIISLIQVYATPVNGGNKNIKLGFLDTGISSPVVANQFVTIDCGSVQIKEVKKNATDYAPYVSINLYLPFIGIVELNTNECMNSTMNVKYIIDVYTGTCLAKVSITRATDMPHSPTLYTFSGNCSQQIPLTSGNATGVLNALIGGITAGISAASGGGLSTLAGAQLLGNSLTHEMFHVSHSGNISANAGIMGHKKPYVIIGRQQPYDANNYSTYYGFPANKTVVIGNHSGFLRVKKCWIKTKATQTEYNKIMELLNEGVFV